MRRILIVPVALITMGTAAHAAILAAGALWGGSVQDTAVCYVYNAGLSPVTVAGAQIIRQNFGAIPLLTNNCGFLPPEGICAFAANIVNFVAHGCKVVVLPDGAAAAVRGTLDIRHGGTELQSEQMR